MKHKSIHDWLKIENRMKSHF